MTKVEVSKVEILGGEGVIDFVDQFKGVYPSIEVADKALALLAHRAPESGAYNKTDFVVTWSDGESWEGTLCLNRDHRRSSDILGDHIRAIVDYESGDATPTHLTREQYTDFMRRRLREYPQHCENFRKFRETYKY